MEMVFQDFPAVCLKLYFSMQAEAMKFKTNDSKFK